MESATSDLKESEEVIAPTSTTATDVPEASAQSEEVESGPPENKRVKPNEEKLMHLAVAGCSHGEMDKIYEQLGRWEQQHAMKFDLLICCGDFQAIRNYGDLEHLHVPDKYRQLMTFYKYYSGEKVAPVLTLFVGGNHESSGFMAELPNGGWVAPNIYYMGYSAVVKFGGLRIAGLSGIYKGNDYDRGHFERPPFHERGSLISAYHVRSLDVFRMKQLKNRDDDKTLKLDVVVTHDWPAGITDYGDRDLLLRIKPYFTEDINKNQLGNPATMNLLHELKPKRWFAAHLHVKFTAEVEHPVKEDSIDKLAQKTKFLSLDKPLPRRKFLEWLEVPMEEDESGQLPSFELSYDPVWLAILRNTDFLTVLTDKRVYMPGKTGSSERYDFRPTKEELEQVNVVFNNDFRIPKNFRMTAPPEKMPYKRRKDPPSLYYRNPQSTEFCQKLGIKDFNGMMCEASKNFVGLPYFCEQLPSSVLDAGQGGSNEQDARNPEEIDVGDDEFGDDCFVIDPVPTTKTT